MTFKAKICFLGDISLNDAYVDLAEQSTSNSPFTNVKDYLGSVDFVVGNLECTVGTSAGENELKTPRLKTSTAALAYLQDLHLNLALLANNHVYDNLEEGFAATSLTLRNQGIQSMGAALNEASAKLPYIAEINGLKICFLNYVSSDTNPKIPEDSSLKVNFFDAEQVTSDISRVRRDVDFVVVCPHWGGDFECGYYPNPVQSETAKQLFSAGADLIVGHHSHTLQPFEIIDGKYVFHSLGNFCFANIRNFGHEIDQKKGTESVIIEVNFSENGCQTDIIPIRNIDGNIEINSNCKLKAIKKRNRRYQKLKDNPMLFKLYAIKHRYFDTLYFFFFGNKRRGYDQLYRINLSRIKYFLNRS